MANFGLPRNQTNYKSLERFWTQNVLFIEFDPLFKRYEHSFQILTCFTMPTHQIWSCTFLVEKFCTFNRCYQQKTSRGGGGGGGGGHPLSAFRVKSMTQLWKHMKIKISKLNFVRQKKFEILVSHFQKSPENCRRRHNYQVWRNQGVGSLCSVGFSVCMGGSFQSQWSIYFLNGCRLSL